MRKVRHAEDVIQIENVGAIEVGRPVRLTQIGRIVAVIEQAQAALFVECVRVGVRGADLQSVAHTFVDVHLKRVVGVDTGGPIGNRLRRVADVRDAQIDVATLVVGQVR